MQGTQVWSLGPEGTPGEGNGNSLQYSRLEKPHGQRSLAGHSPWGHKESDTTERLTRRMMHTNVHSSIILRAKERKQLKCPSHNWWTDQGSTHLHAGTLLDSTPTETLIHVRYEGILLLFLRMSSKLGVPVYNHPWHPALGYRELQSLHVEWLILETVSVSVSEIWWVYNVISSSQKCLFKLGAHFSTELPISYRFVEVL